MIPGIQTHFEGWVDPAELAYLYNLGYRIARIAATECTDATTYEMVRDAKDAGFTVIVTLIDPQRIRLVAPLFTAGDFVECRNEDDGDLWAQIRGTAMWPEDYRDELDKFCKIGLELGVPIGGPTCSNTNAKCVQWAKQVRGTGWPKGMKYLTWHSYDPHENTMFKEMEALADGMPICITEFGYPSMGQTPEAEALQAEKAKQLWPLYSSYHSACWFQIHDGSNPNEREHCYGLQRTNGDKGWKPVAYSVPQKGDLVSDATYTIFKSESFEIRPGEFVTYFPKGQTATVLSIQPDGKKDVRLKEAAGAWETWRPSKDGGRAVFHETAEGYAFPLEP